MLAVNNSKNPVHNANSLAKYSKVGEDAGSCCNHGKNPRGGVGRYGLLLRVFSSCNVAPKNHTDVPRHDEQTKCNSSLHLIGAYGPAVGVVSSCKVAPNITMMFLRRGARSMPACYFPLGFLPTLLGTCFGKAAIIRPRATPSGLGRQASQARERLG